jgi:transposase InsO family protein
VPTIRFQVLYVFLVLAHDRRPIVHFNVTRHPTAEWTVQQLREAFPFEQIPRYLLRDRDAISGAEFGEGVKAIGIQEVLSAPRSPWQQAYVERVIGTIRRECLDHLIVQRGFPIPAREVLPGVLSRIQDAPFAGQGSAGTAIRATAGVWAGRCDSTSGRSSPPV